LGLSVVVTYLARMRQIHENYLAGSIDPTGIGYQNFQSGLAKLEPHLQSGRSLAELSVNLAQQSVLAQSDLLAYGDAFRFLAAAVCMCLPIMLLLRRPKRAALLNVASGH
jgi:hypothetical protein